MLHIVCSTLSKKFCIWEKIQCNVHDWQEKSYQNGGKTGTLTVCHIYKSLTEGLIFILFFPDRWRQAGSNLICSTLYPKSLQLQVIKWDLNVSVALFKDQKPSDQSAIVMCVGKQNKRCTKKDK